MKLGKQTALERVLSPVRDELAKSEEFERIEKLAYPDDAGKGKENAMPNVSDVLEMLQRASLGQVEGQLERP